MNAQQRESRTRTNLGEEVEEVDEGGNEGENVDELLLLLFALLGLDLLVVTLRKLVLLLEVLLGVRWGLSVKGVVVGGGGEGGIVGVGEEEEGYEKEEEKE